MGVIILGANTLYINFCLFKEIPMLSEGLLRHCFNTMNYKSVSLCVLGV